MDTIATNKTPRTRLPASTLWIMLLTLASTAATLAFACATPFAALAALAATQMRGRDGVLLMLAAWAASQLVGFCVLGYPRDPSTIAWGAALGTAAVAAVLAARFATARAAIGADAIRISVAFLAAAAGFKAVVALWALRLGGLSITLSPSLTAHQLLREAAMLAGLYALYRVLVIAGVPAATRRRAATA